MRSKIHGNFSPWSFFIVLTVLTVVSQLWILRTSVQEKGGAFTLRTGQADQPAEIEAETLSGFTVHQETPSVIALARAGHDFFSIDSSVPGQIILSSQTTSFGEPALDEDGKLTIPYGATGQSAAHKPATLQIEQKVFGALFQSSTGKRLQVERLAPGACAYSTRPRASSSFTRLECARSAWATTSLSSRQAIPRCHREHCSSR